MTPSTQSDEPLPRHPDDDGQPGSRGPDDEVPRGGAVREGGSPQASGKGFERGTDSGPSPEPEGTGAAGLGPGASASGKRFARGTDSDGDGVGYDEDRGGASG